MSTANDVKIVLSAEDKTAAAFSAVKSNLGAVKTGIDTAAASASNFGGLLTASIGGLSIAAFAGIIKGSIDSAAAMHDLAIQTGASVEALSGLASVGKFSDTSAQDIAAAMNKLSKNMAGATEESKGAGKALEALGINVENFKALDPDAQFMALSKSMDGFRDGSGKSAAAMALLGKEGAKLLPFLKDLAVTGELQAKITTAQAAAADDFSDNLLRLRGSSEGWKKELTMGMLPALNTALQAFVDVGNGAGGLREGVRALSKDGSLAQWTSNAVLGVSYVMDAFSGLLRVIKSVGQWIGVEFAVVADFTSSVGEAFDKVSKRDFSGAWDSLTGAARRSKVMVQEYAGELDTMWSEETLGQKLRKRISELEKMGSTAAAIKPKLQFADVLEKKAKEVKDPFKDLMAEIENHISAYKVEIETGNKLTESQKYAVTVRDQLRKSAKSLKAGEEDLVRTKLELLLATEKEVLFAREVAKANSEAASAQDKHIASLQAGLEKMQQNNAAQEDANLRLGLGKEAIAALDAARLEEQATILEGLGIKALEKNLDETQYNLYKQQAAELRTLAGLKREGAYKEVAIDAAKEAEAAWRKASDSIESSLTDALMRGFDAGKGFFKSLWDSITNTFKTSILRPIVQAVVSPVSGAVTASLGFSGAATAATGASAAGSLFAEGSTLGNAFTGVTAAMSQFGTAALASTQSLLGLTGTAAQASSAATLGAAAQTGASTLANSVGAAMPYVAAAVAVAAALGLFRSTKTVGTGIMGTVGETSDVTGYDLKRKSGYLFGGPDYSLSTTALDATTAKTINDSVSAVYNGSRAYAAALGLSTEALNGFTTQLGSDLIHPDTGGIGIDLTGLSSDQAVAKINAELAKVGDAYAQQLIGTFEDVTTAFTRTVMEQIGNNYDGSITAERTVTGTTTQRTYIASEFAKDGETASQTLARLSTSLLSVNALFDGMGKSMLTASLASGDIASQLLDAFGGLENANSRLTSYYATYYTAGERAANTTRLLTNTLATLGIDALPTSLAGFRALVDAQDLTTESGRNTYATLVGVSQSFASLVPAADAAQGAVAGIGKTLEQIASERAGIEDALLGLLGETAVQRQRELATLDPANRALKTMVYTVQDAQAAISTLSDDIANLDAISRQAATLSNSISVALGGADNTQAGLWATVNDASALASDRLTAVGSLLDVINASISTDTAAAQQALAAGAQDAQKAIDALNAKQTAAAQLQLSNAERMVDLGKQLRGYVQDLKVGSLSSLTPAQRLSQAAGQYQASLAGAQAGDAASMASLQGNAGTYLELARSFDPGSYAQVFSDVTTSLDSVSGTLMSDGQRALAAANEQLAALQSISSAAATQASAAVAGNVISDANRQALESLLSISATIQADAVVERASKQAQLTIESLRMEDIRAALSATGLLPASAAATATALADAGVLVSSAASASTSLATLPATLASNTDAMVAEIRALNARIATLESTLVQAAAAQIDAAVTVGAQTAAALTDGLSSAAYQSTLAASVI